MRILFDNYALAATVTSLDASGNYPPTNLVHPFLRKRYQNITGDDTDYFSNSIPTVLSIVFTLDTTTQTKRNC